MAKLCACKHTRSFCIFLAPSNLPLSEQAGDELKHQEMLLYLKPPTSKISVEVKFVTESSSFFCFNNTSRLEAVLNSTAR